MTIDPIEKMDRAAAAQLTALREWGLADNLLGVELKDSPLTPGSWFWNRWVEGWTETLEPYRDLVDGAWNMTPAEHVAAYEAWIRGFDLPAAQVYKAIEYCRAAYVPASLLTP